jgi:hypothetical protein
VLETLDVYRDIRDIGTVPELRVNDGNGDSPRVEGDNDGNGDSPRVEGDRDSPRVEGAGMTAIFSAAKSEIDHRSDPKEGLTRLFSRNFFQLGAVLLR